MVTELAWSGDSPSGRLLMIVVNPAALSAGRSSGLICGDTLTWSLIRLTSNTLLRLAPGLPAQGYRRRAEPGATGAKGLGRDRRDADGLGLLTFALGAAVPRHVSQSSRRLPPPIRPVRPFLGAVRWRQARSGATTHRRRSLR